MPTVNTQTEKTENLNTKFTADMVRTYLREIGRVSRLIWCEPICEKLVV